MALPINQKEYLKRYLSAETDDSSKKKRRKKVKTSVKVTRTFTVVDDDVDIKSLAPASAKEDNINNPLLDDETPLIADIIDERPKDEVIMEEYRTSKKWKTMADDNQASWSTASAELHKKVSPAQGRRSRHDSSDSDLSPPRKSPSSKPSRRRDSDSDESPPRRKGVARDSSNSDPSPPRRRRPGTQSSSRRQGQGQRNLCASPADSDLSPVRNSTTKTNSSRRSNQREHFRHSKSQSRNKDTNDAPKSSPPRKSYRHDSSDYDLSPRRSKHRSSESDSRRQELPRRRHDDGSDVSPVRRDRARGTGMGERRHGRHDSDADISPPRKGQDRRGNTPLAIKHDSDSDLSPPRRGQDTRGDARGNRSAARPTRHDSDLDHSPPRQGRGTRVDARENRSPARPTRHDSDSDLSPPRRGKSRGDERGNRPPVGHAARQDSDSDLTPPRQKRRQDSDSDLSPVRRGAPGKGRGSRKPEADRSPRRREEATETRSSRDGRGGKKRPDKTLSGTTAGLSDAKSMRRENEESRRRDASMYSKMADDVSGRNAETVFRDKSGRTRDLESEKRQKRVDEAKKAEEDEKFVEWGKGVAQNAQQKAFVQDALHEMDKPLARYRDDQDLDEMLKQQEKEGDPMLEFMRSKRTKKQAAMGVKAKPKYKGPLPPPNRFNIMPGYRWDGVDRSNGFEKKAFVRQADKKAMKEIAYKWSIEDM